MPGFHSVRINGIWAGGLVRGNLTIESPYRLALPDGSATANSLHRDGDQALGINFASDPLRFGISGVNRHIFMDVGWQVRNTASASISLRDDNGNNAVALERLSTGFAITAPSGWSVGMTSTHVNLNSTRVQFNALANVGSTAAAAALGNVGGADGPAGQAQIGWLKIADSSGGPAFVAYWK